MMIRAFTTEGISEFTKFLDFVRLGQISAVPLELLTNSNLTREAANAEVTRVHLATRFDAAQYLSERLREPDVNTTDPGLWTWLSAFFFDELCPVDTHGNRRPGATARWIPATDDYRRYYRHLLAGPYLIFQAHMDNPRRAMALLCQPVHTPGEIVEQLASRQELITNKAVVEIATMLYVDQSTDLPKSGTSGKGPGSPRRLADIHSQFDVTWDLYNMSAAEFAAILPHEFKKWLTPSVRPMRTKNLRVAAYERR